MLDSGRPMCEVVGPVLMLEGVSCTDFHTIKVGAVPFLRMVPDKYRLPHRNHAGDLVDTLERCLRLRLPFAGPFPEPFRFRLAALSICHPFLLGRRLAYDPS